MDAELVHRSLARSRDDARVLIECGRVVVNGIVAVKPATQVEGHASIVVRADDQDPGYVSRGAHKLVGALDHFALDPQGLRCLDAGASTGGFTDVLLRRGAASVIAVDVGYGQLAWALQSDSRVTVLDRTNVRTLTPEAIAGPVDLVVGDLSFISLALVLPALAFCAKPGGRMLLMVKPQFEVGKERLGRGGVVREPGLRAETVTTIGEQAAALGWGAEGVVASPLPGPAGNVEYFLLLSRTAPPLRADDVDDAVAKGPA